MALVVGLAVVLHRLRGRSVLLRLGGWLLGTVLACATIVLACPPPDTRAAGGGDPPPTRQVSTREGPVRGVMNDARTVEIFAGIPYARPPIGDLRWRAPEPPETRGHVFVADRFSAVPIQATSTFFTRTLSPVSSSSSARRMQRRPTTASPPSSRSAAPHASMAGVVAFLASTDSSFMLGANVLVDGGVNQI